MWTRVYRSTNVCVFSNLEKNKTFVVVSKDIMWYV